VRLSVGLDLMRGALPSEISELGGNAEGLANSVQPLVEVDAPVQNSGSGFAPNVIPAVDF